MLLSFTSGSYQTAASKLTLPEVSRSLCTISPVLRHPQESYPSRQHTRRVSLWPPSDFADKATHSADREMLNSKHFGLLQMWLNYLNVLKQSAMSKQHKYHISAKWLLLQCSACRGQMKYLSLFIHKILSYPLNFHIAGLGQIISFLLKQKNHQCIPIGFSC